MLRKMNIVISKISIESINATGGLAPQTPISRIPLRLSAARGRSPIGRRRPQTPS